MVKFWERYFRKEIEEMKYVPIEQLPELKKQLELNMQERFLKICLDALDTEITPQDNVPDYVACAEVISTLIKKVIPDFPIISSTKDLDASLGLSSYPPFIHF